MYLKILNIEDIFLIKDWEFNLAAGQIKITNQIIVIHKE